MHRIPDTEFVKTPTYKVLTLTRRSRPTTRFVNVGSAFMNARDLGKRKVASQRRSREKRDPVKRQLALNRELKRRTKEEKRLKEMEAKKLEKKKAKLLRKKSIEV